MGWLVGDESNKPAVNAHRIRDQSFVIFNQKKYETSSSSTQMHALKPILAARTLTGVLSTLHGRRAVTRADRLLFKVDSEFWVSSQGFHCRDMYRSDRALSYRKFTPVTIVIIPKKTQPRVPSALVREFRTGRSSVKILATIYNHVLSTFARRILPGVRFQRMRVWVMRKPSALMTRCHLSWTY